MCCVSGGAAAARGRQDLSLPLPALQEGVGLAHPLGLPPWPLWLGLRCPDHPSSPVSPGSFKPSTEGGVGLGEK